jgi:phenylalanine-4-hydroxylase
VNQALGLYADPIRTAEDYGVWSEYLKFVGPGVSNLEWKFPAYCDGVSSLAPSTARIPSLKEINGWLGTINWQAVYHPGFVPALEYARLQATRTFPIARHIRKRRDFMHSPAPDFIHDVFGHLPMLFESNYEELIQAWAIKRAQAEATPEDRAVSAAQNQLIVHMEQLDRDPQITQALTSALENAQAAASEAPSLAGRLENFYTWCMEYGMVDSCRGHPKVVGGAILSSLGETRRVVNGQVTMSRFQRSTLNRPVNYAVYQDEMYSVSDFRQFHEVLDEI